MLFENGRCTSLDTKTMVAATLTDDLIADGAALLAKIDASDLRVDAAFWCHFEDTSGYALVLSVKRIESTGPRLVYRMLQRMMSKQPKPKVLNLDDVTLAKPDAVLLRVIRSLVNTGGQGTHGMRFMNCKINGIPITDVHIYRA